MLHTTFSVHTLSHILLFPMYPKLCSCNNLPVWVYRYLATFYNRSGSYVTPQRISKTIGEITRVTSAAVIHSISPSPQQGMLPLHPQPISGLSLSQSVIWASSLRENPLKFFQSIGCNSLLLIYCLFKITQSVPLGYLTQNKGPAVHNFKVITFFFIIGELTHPPYKVLYPGIHTSTVCWDEYQLHLRMPILTLTHRYSIFRYWF